MGRLGAVDMEEPKTSVFAPFETVFLARREAILRLVGVSSYALRSMSGAAHLSEVLNYEAQHVEHIRKIEEIAASEVSLDFPLLHSAGTVLLWGALESAFRDFVVRWLTCYPLARQVPELKKVRVSVAEYEFREEDRMRYLAEILERDLAAALRPGVGRFDCILKPFGIHPKIDEAHRRNLLELAALRNVIVHRAGVADERLRELCPWLELEIGQTVSIRAGAFDRFVQASSYYVAAIIVSGREVIAAGELSRV